MKKKIFLILTLLTVSQTQFAPGGREVCTPYKGDHALMQNIAAAPLSIICYKESKQLSLKHLNQYRLFIKIPATAILGVFSLASINLIWNAPESRLATSCAAATFFGTLNGIWTQPKTALEEESAK
jgi:hypothetical protein